MGSNWDAGKPNEKCLGKIMCFYLLGLTAVGMCGIEGTWPGFFLSQHLSHKNTNINNFRLLPHTKTKKQYGPYYESLLNAGYFHLSKD